MNNFIQGSVPVFSRLMHVVFIFALGVATIIAVSIVADSWTSVSSGHVLVATAGAFLLVAVLVIEMLRRTVRYIFLGDAFFKGRPDLALKVFLAIPLIMLLASAVMTPLAFSAQAKEQAEARTVLKEKYDYAVANLPAAQAAKEQCLAQAKEDRRASCALKRNKVKADYDFCMSLTAINTHASCIYDHNYTEYECTGDVIKSPDFFDKIVTECNSQVRTESNYKATISEYESI